MKNLIDIEDLLDRAKEQLDSGTKKFYSMSYEEGIIATLEFILEQDDCDPLDD